MRLFMSLASALTLAMLHGGQAVAQQPAAPPPNPPASHAGKNAVRYSVRHVDQCDRAKLILAAAEAEGKKRGWKMNIAVVDTNGDLVHFLRMDGAQIASVNISQGKARTAARYRRPTQLFYNAYETGHPYVSTLDPTLIASPGGFPLVEGGKLIGAIGCSGGTGDQDAAICKVGADMVQ